MRRLAESYAGVEPAVACAHKIEAGDAFALATRFDCDWAYRSGTALFWRREIRATSVHERFPPSAPLRPFDRRAVLHVEAELDGKPLDFVAATLGEERASCLRDLRFLRKMLRVTYGCTIAFVGNAATVPIGFADLRFETRAQGDYNLIVVRPSQATPPPQTAGSHEASASIERI